MIWTFGIACVPLGYLFLLPVFLSFDPSLEESAYIAGSRPVNTMLKITFPIGDPGFHFRLCAELSARAALVRDAGAAGDSGQHQSFCQPRLRLDGPRVQYRTGDGV